jgi:hypothetical protein
MSIHVTVALVVLKTVTLLLGGSIMYFAYRAHSRTGARPLWYLAVGFGIVTLGTILGGLVDQVIRFSLLSGSGLPFALASLGDQAVADVALVVESALTTVGFAVIVYSMYTE